MRSAGAKSSFAQAIAHSCLLFCAIFSLALPAKAERSADGANMRTINAIAVVELLKNESPAEASERIQPLAAIANLSLEPIGFRLKFERVETQTEIPGATTFELLRNLASVWSTREDSRNIVIAFPNGVRNDQSFGLAMPRTACMPSQAVASISYLGSAPEDLLNAGHTLAHELGHFLGAEHDWKSVVDGGLFSLMYPYSLPLIGGFSGFSKNQIEAFVGPAGDETCLSESLFELNPITIEGPSEGSVAEGQTLATQFAVRGSTDPVWFHAENLPFGAVFDSARGVLYYRPEASVSDSGATAEFQIRLIAETFGAKVEHAFTLRVLDRPEAPPANFFSETVLLGKSGKVKLSLPFNSSAEVSCSAAPKGLSVKKKKGLIKFSGKLRTDTVVQCVDGLSGATTELRFVVPAKTTKH